MLAPKYKSLFSYFDNEKSNIGVVMMWQILDSETQNAMRLYDAVSSVRDDERTGADHGI